MMPKMKENPNFIFKTHVKFSFAAWLKCAQAAQRYQEDTREEVIQCNHLLWVKQGKLKVYPIAEAAGSGTCL